MPIRQNALSIMAFALSFALTACGAGNAQQAAAPPLVRTIVVAPAAAETIRHTGIVRARIESNLGFRVGGMIVERLVNPGDRVRRGQALMRIDATDLSLAATAASERLRAAQAEAARAGADEARMRPLVEEGFVSRSNYDAALASARSAAANVAAARATAREASNQRGYTTLVADADGVVMQVLAQPGEVVAAGLPVVQLARAGDREAVVSIPETQAQGLPGVGQAYLYGSDARFPARLRELSAAADPLTRTYEARYALGDAGSSAPLGATITVELRRPERANVAVPLSAIHDPGSGPGLWLVRDGRVTFRRVAVASLQDGQALVAPGAVSRGDRIVALGAHLLRNGQAVRPTGAGERRP